MSVPIVPLILGESSPATISLSDLTTGNIGGTGVFDILMSTTAKYLEEEFEKNRITGKEYSTVYLGAIAAVLQQSIAYLTTGKQVEKLNAEIALVRQQTVTEFIQTGDAIPAGLGFNTNATVEGTVAKQNISLQKQIDKLESEIQLTKQKTVTELVQTDDHIPIGLAYNNSTSVEGVLAKQNLVIDKQNLATDKQIEKFTAEIDLIKQKTVTELLQSDDDIPAGLGFNNGLTVEGIIAKQNLVLDKQNEAIDKQIAKSEAEIWLVKQKTVTELVQTDDDIPSCLAYNNGLTVEGLISKQILNMNKQNEAIDKQMLKTDSDITLTKQKIITELAITDDDIPEGIGLNNDIIVAGSVSRQNVLLEQQVLKIASEIQLLGQKAVTELAQTKDTIPLSLGLNEGGAVEGVVLKQKGLYAAQTEGFARDAEQKLVKSVLDTWSIRRSTDDGTATPDGINDSDITALVRKAASGIGVSV